MADLLQQQKPAASSEEERLAAGILTTGLQTKRLSGAQRKKLIREKKMGGPGRWKNLQGKLLHLKPKKQRGVVGV
jgi:hypothetical protein